MKSLYMHHHEQKADSGKTEASKSRLSLQTGFSQTWNMHASNNKMWMIDRLYMDVFIADKVKSF